MFKSILEWIIAIMAVIVAFAGLGFIIGVIYGLVGTAFEIGKLLWN